MCPAITPLVSSILELIVSNDESMSTNLFVVNKERSFHVFFTDSNSVDVSSKSFDTF